MSPTVANRKSEKLYAFVKMAANMEMNSFILNIFVELACSEQDIVVTALVWCVCCACVHCGFVRAITSTFVHGFQNNLAQLFSLKGRIAILNFC